MMTVIQWLLVTAGVFSMIQGLTKLGFNFGRTSRWVNRIGEVPTQVIMIVTGISLIVIGISGWIT